MSADMEQDTTAFVDLLYVIDHIVNVKIAARYIVVTVLVNDESGVGEDRDMISPPNWIEFAEVERK